jgi:hypothetical protein
VPNNGVESKGDEAEIDTLQARNTGINRDRDNEYHSNFHGDQTRSVGKEQRYRPNQSPVLKRRKWNDINITGEVMIPQEGGLTERIVLVIGGNTDYTSDLSASSKDGHLITHQGDSQHAGQGKIIHDIGFGNFPEGCFCDRPRTIVAREQWITLRRFYRLGGFPFS